MPERAHPGDPIWQKRLGLFPTKALSYLRKRYRFCGRFVSGKRVLDVPCGTGMGFVHLRDAAQVFGLDKDPAAISFATEHYASAHSGCMVGDMVELPFPGSSVDAVVCVEGIEHVIRSDGVKFVSEAARILGDGGVLLLSCPMSVDSGHSGNEYHLYEWSKDELLDLIGYWFPIEEHRIVNGPAGPVILLAARRPPSGRREDSVVSPLLLKDTRYEHGLRQVGRWVKREWCESGARYTRSSDAALLPTCFAVLAEETLGTLAGWKESRRRTVAEGILAQQDPETGLFGPHLVRQQDLLWPQACDLRYVRYQLTYFALGALNALGSLPSYPLQFAQQFLRTDYSLGWVEGGPWHNPWNHSNRIMFLLRFLIHLGREEGRAEALQVFDAVIDELLRQQSRETGLWHGFAECDVRQAVYAAYHFFPFMFWRGVLPPQANKIIDSTLSIQHADGLFGAQPGGGACEDLDAIAILTQFSLVSQHRADDVKLALTRAFDRILQIQSQDGGFPNYLPSTKKSLRARLRGRLANILVNSPHQSHITYYSGWTSIWSEQGESDMWAAWFRPLALGLIVSRYPDLGTLPTDARFQSIPGLGWHDENLIRSSR